MLVTVLLNVSFTNLNDIHSPIVWLADGLPNLNVIMSQGSSVSIGGDWTGAGQLRMWVPCCCCYLGYISQSCGPGYRLDHRGSILGRG
jgi:hypothetical protein